MNILDFRALAANGDWTNAFKKAAEACRDAGGGIITVPAGVYPTHSIRLYSNTTFVVESGAVILYFKEMEGYEIIDLCFEGIAGKAAMPLIFAENAKNITVTGGGTLNGQGDLWWEAVHNHTLTVQRPYFVCFSECEHVILENVTLLNSPSWTVHPLNSSDVVVRGLTIHNPWDSPNTDGINPDSSNNVRISDCLIDVGDDCIAIKSGTEDTLNPKPCENILITNCLMLNGHGGVVIGSEMSGGVRNVLVTGCIFRGTDRGIRLKTRRFRGGAVSNITFSHILMEEVQTPFVFNMYYYCGKGGKEAPVRDKSKRPVDEKTPSISDVRIESVTAVNATACAGFVYGLPESPVTRITMKDCTVTMKTGKKSQAAMMDDLEDFEARGLFLRNAEDFVLENFTVVGQIGDAHDTDASCTTTR